MLDVETAQTGLPEAQQDCLLLCVTALEASVSLRVDTTDVGHSWGLLGRREKWTVIETLAHERLCWLGFYQLDTNWKRRLH